MPLAASVRSGHEGCHKRETNKFCDWQRGVECARVVRQRLGLGFNSWK